MFFPIYNRKDRLKSFFNTHILYDNLAQKATVWGQCRHYAQIQKEKMTKNRKSDATYCLKFTKWSHFRCVCAALPTSQNEIKSTLGTKGCFACSFGVIWKKLRDLHTENCKKAGCLASCKTPRLGGGSAAISRCNKSN